jgi:hypothetical protein
VNFKYRSKCMINIIVLMMFRMSIQEEGNAGPEKTKAGSFGGGIENKSRKFRSTR